MNITEASFAAFFMGEGMIRVSKEKRTRWGREIVYYRQIARITLRQDDEAVLDWILANIGGHIFRRGIRNKVTNKLTGTFTRSNPVTIWQVEDVPTCIKIANLLIKSPIPSKKKKEAVLFKEYLETKKKYLLAHPQKTYTDKMKERFLEIEEEMKSLKKFKGV